MRKVLSFFNKFKVHRGKNPVKISGTLKLYRKRGIIFLNKPSKLSLIFTVLAVAAVVLSIASISVPLVPAIWYRLKPDTSKAMSKILARPTVTFGDLLVGYGEGELASYQPDFDPSLPKENRLVIPKLEVDTEILEESLENYEEALRRGVWRVPDFGTPFARRYPTILTAHRFGYLVWTNAYRQKNSFFNLPKLVAGDRLEIYWKQRRYTYEIYGGEESEKLTDYKANLILYTCRFLESPIRIFRFAKLVRTG